MNQYDEKLAMQRQLARKRNMMGGRQRGQTTDIEENKYALRAAKNDALRYMDSSAISTLPYDQLKEQQEVQTVLDMQKYNTALDQAIAEKQAQDLAAQKSQLSMQQAQYAPVLSDQQAQLKADTSALDAAKNSVANIQPVGGTSKGTASKTQQLSEQKSQMDSMATGMQNPTESAQKETSYQQPTDSSRKLSSGSNSGFYLKKKGPMFKALGI